MENFTKNREEFYEKKILKILRQILKNFTTNREKKFTKNREEFYDKT